MSEMPTLQSRPLNITYNIPINKTLKFWEGLKEGKVYAMKCKKCGKIYFPPSSDCPSCLASDMEWIELSGEGEIETFTHVIVRPASFQDERPYTVAIARMKEGVRVLAWLVGVKKKDIKVGLKVKLEAEVTPEGKVRYIFTPANI
ncbi:MAG TPA: Zn-ribbon domain-containing OB-fold protein [Candidatus Bathyarchaeota archaeon]|nr:Zn-ribbon domain-containing OB-fold protein [Candidatus Bathyarchaeota archaeon]